MTARGGSSGIENTFKILSLQRTLALGASREWSGVVSLILFTTSTLKRWVQPSNLMEIGTRASGTPKSARRFQ